MTQTNVGVITSGENIDLATQPLSDCLKGSYQLVETLYTNVCTGEVFSIVNGFWDYATYLTIFGMGFAIIAIIFTMILDY